MAKNELRISSLLTKVHEKMGEPSIRTSAGVSGFGWKFATVFLLYAFAFALMGIDPWYGGGYRFEWTQGVFVLLISFFIVTTMAFDWKILGPTMGSNCLLSLFLIVPFSLFAGRIMGKAAHTELEWSVLGEVIDKVKGLSGVLGLTSMIPKWVQEIFSSPGMAILLVGVCVALAVKNKTAQKGLLLTALLVPFMSAFAYEPQVSSWFIIGMILMFTGMGLQFMDMNKYHWDAVLLSTFKAVKDVAERKSSIRIMEHVRKHGRITDRTLYSIARRCYQEDHKVDAMKLPEITLALAQRLVAEHGLLGMQMTNEGQYFVRNKKLFVVESKLEEIIRWPRNAIICVIAILWMLSPIDILPDALPGGTIDDALIAFLGFSPFMQQVVGAMQHRGGSHEDSIEN
jgi:hypothetical protein